MPRRYVPALSNYFDRGLVLLFSCLLISEIAIDLHNSVGDVSFYLTAVVFFFITLLRPFIGIALFVSLMPLINGAYLLEGYIEPYQLFSFVYLGWCSRFIIKSKNLKSCTVHCLLVRLLIIILLLNLILVAVRMTPWPMMSKYWLEWISAYRFSKQVDPLWQIYGASVFLKGLFFFHMVCNEVQNENQWGLFSRLVYPLAWCTMVFSFAQYYNNINNDANSLGVTLPFNDIHSFGSAVVLLLVIHLVMLINTLQSLSLPLYSPSLKQIKLRLIANFFNVIALSLLCVFTSSRVTWLVMVLMLIVILQQAITDRKKKVFGAILILMAGIVGNQMENSFKKADSAALNRLGTLFSVENIYTDEALKVRYELWKRALKIVEEYPATGIGVGNFYRSSQFFQTRSVGQWDRENAHNYYLHVAAELGFPGVVIFIGILLLLLLPRRAIPPPPKRDSPTSEKISLRAFKYGLFAYLLTMLTGHPLLLSSQQFLFWYIAGVIATGESLRNETSFKSSPLEKILVIVGGVALTIYILGFTINIIKGEPWTINRTYGFYSEEDWDGTAMRWTSAKATCKLESANQKVFLKIVALPFNSTPPQGLNLRIAVNGKTVENLHFVDGGSRIVSLSGNEEEMQVTFEVDRVFRPKEIGLSDDTRLLGVAVGRLEALPFQPAIQLMLLRN